MDDSKKGMHENEAKVFCLLFHRRLSKTYFKAPFTSIKKEFSTGISNRTIFSFPKRDTLRLLILDLAESAV
jgi:hypothetical protein